MRLFLFILLFAFSASAASYYVDPVAGNNANAGSEAQPWQTIYYATRTSGVIAAGDTIFLRGGAYRGLTNSIDLGVGVGASGTEANPITLKAYPGETPVVSDIFASDRAVILRSRGWWVIDGVTYSNNYQHFYFENITNCSFINNSFLRSATSHNYPAVGHYGATIQYLTYSNNLFYQWGSAIAGTPCDDSGVSISFGDESNDYPVYYNLIISNRFFYGMHDHLQLSSGYNVIRGNLFVNAPWLATNATCYTANFGTETNNYGLYGNRQTKPGDAGLVQADARNVFEYNQFLYTGPPTDDAGAFGIELGTRQGIYRFNTIAYSLAAGIFLNTSGTTSRSTSNAIYGNTIVANGLSHTFGGEGMQDFSYGISMSTFEGRRTNNFIVNNLVRSCQPANIDPNILLYQDFRGNFTNDASNPLFVSTNGFGYTYDAENLPDFRLQAGSPCIDAGTWLTYVPASGSGTTLALTNSLYFSDGNRVVTGDTIQLEGQTTTATVVSNDFANHTLYLGSSLTWTEGQGVSLTYNGIAPDAGAFEYQAAGGAAVTVRGPVVIRGGTLRVK